MESKEKKLLIWPNGLKADCCFEIFINHSVNSLKRLKDCILAHISKIPSDKLRIFNHKGIEIDDADISYLHNNQLLYISVDGSNFNVNNYVNEHEFCIWIKSGGYGKVYMAKQVITGEEVAIKKQDVSELTTEEIYNISREAILMESFKHRNIIKFIHSYIFENQFYTVMEYARGGELGNYLNKAKILSEFEARRVFKQLHEAVRYIHSKNVVHRDLKPNNILFLDEQRENLVVIDFGISGISHGNVKETVKAGTTKFVPPEIASGLNYNSSTKIDIWALGVILWLMVFGCYPFDSKSDSEVLSKIINEPHKFPANIQISKAGKNLLNGLLEKNQFLRVETNDPLFDEWYNDETVENKVLCIEEEKKETASKEAKEDAERKSGYNRAEELKSIEEEIKKMKFSKSISDKGNNKINVNNLPLNSIVNSNFNSSSSNNNNNNRKVVSFAKSAVNAEENRNEANKDGNSISSSNKKTSRAQSTSIKFFQNSAIKRSESSAAKNNISVINKSAAKKK